MDVATHELRNGNTLAPMELAFCSWLAQPDTVRRSITITRPDVLELANMPLDTLPKPSLNIQGRDAQVQMIQSE